MIARASLPPLGGSGISKLRTRGAGSAFNPWMRPGLDGCRGESGIELRAFLHQGKPREIAAGRLRGVALVRARSIASTISASTLASSLSPLSSTAILPFPTSSSDVTAIFAHALGREFRPRASA